MGRAISMVKSSFVGVRVAGELTYIPAYVNGTIQVSQKCIIPVYANSNHGVNQKTGEPGRTDTYKLIARGRLADTCCRSLSQGKAVDAFCEPQTYTGKLYNANGTLRVDGSGQPIETHKESHMIENIIFGEESDRIIEAEIAAGLRPMNWNVKNHPEYQMWIQVLQGRQKMVWDGQSKYFGYARVLPIPTGAQINWAAMQPKQAQPQQQMMQQHNPMVGNPVGNVTNTFSGRANFNTTQIPVTAGGFIRPQMANTGFNPQQTGGFVQPQMAAAPQGGFIRQGATPPSTPAFNNTMYATGMNYAATDGNVPF